MLNLVRDILICPNNFKIFDKSILFGEIFQISWILCGLILFGPFEFDPLEFLTG